MDKVIPQKCPHCGKPLDFVRDLAGQRIYVKKGWTDTDERDRRIRARLKELVRNGTPKMVAYEVVAHEVFLSATRVRAIIYSA